MSKSSIVNGIIGGTYKSGEIWILKALTPAHIGVGRSLEEAADLPIYRDPFGIPGSPASSTKGALRSDFHRKLTILAHHKLKMSTGDIDDIVNRIESVIFGPPAGRAGEWQWSSAIEVLDANLLFIPVRSLRGIFAYVTSPLLIERFKELLGLMSRYNSDYAEYFKVFNKFYVLSKKIKEYEAIALTKDAFDDLSINNKVLLLETLLLEIQDKSKEAEDIVKVLRQIDANIPDKLLIVSDEAMATVVRRGTWIYTRVALDYEKKIVKIGALWTEEYLPPGTMLYTALLYADAKVIIRDIWGSKINEIVKLLKSWGIESVKITYRAEDVSVNELERHGEGRIEFRGIKKLFKKAILSDEGEGVILIGGNETIGRGMFRVKVLTRGE